MCSSNFITEKWELWELLELRAAQATIIIHSSSTNTHLCLLVRAGLRWWKICAINSNQVYFSLLSCHNIWSICRTLAVDGRKQLTGCSRSPTCTVTTILKTVRLHVKPHTEDLKTTHLAFGFSWLSMSKQCFQQTSAACVCMVEHEHVCVFLR